MFRLLRALAFSLLSLIAAPVAAQTNADPSAALVEILKDDAARAALIERLEQAAAEAAPEPEPLPLGRRLAELSKGAIEQAAGSATGLWAEIARAPEAFRALGLDEIEELIQALTDLALVIFVTVAIYYVLRTLAKPRFRRIGAEAASGGVLRLVALVVVSVLIDAAIVGVAWGAGYAASFGLIGSAGEVGVRQALYLNAFLLIGLVRVGLRAVLSPSAPELRLLRIPDSGAEMLARQVGLMASIIGYGQLLIAPIAARQISSAAGAAVSTLLALVAILLAVRLVLRGRRPVAAWLLEREHEGERGGLARFFAANWHLPVLLWLFALFVVIAARPDGVIWPVLAASAEVLAAIVAGAIAAALLSRSIARGVHMPERVRHRLPLLEQRLNLFVPKALSLARALIVIVVVGFALDRAGLFDFGGWLSGASGARLTSALVSVALILTLTFALWVALASWIDYRLNPEFGARPTSREETLLSLLKNAATIVIVVFSAMFILSEIGVNIAPLIASAGVFGLAIGFGAQKMVQDIITGVFIQFENAMNVGDVVSLNGTTGVVEKLTIRSVSLRDVEGCFHIIPFSSVDMVSNFTKDFAFFVADMGIAYREDVSEAKLAMHDAFDALKQDPEHAPNILAPLQWFGLQALADSAVVLRARIKCAPGTQWATGRAYNEICKRIFDERGIEIPFPHQTIYFGVDKRGEAPPLHIATEPPAASPPRTVQSPSAPVRELDVPDSPEDGDSR